MQRPRRPADSGTLPAGHDPLPHDDAGNRLRRGCALVAHRAPSRFPRGDWIRSLAIDVGTASVSDLRRLAPGHDGDQSRLRPPRLSGRDLRPASWGRRCSGKRSSRPRPRMGPSSSGTTDAYGRLRSPRRRPGGRSTSEAYRIEPRMLKVRRHVVNGGLPDAAPIRILHLTDIQTPGDRRARREGASNGARLPSRPHRPHRRLRAGRAGTAYGRRMRRAISVPSWRGPGSTRRSVSTPRKVDVGRPAARSSRARPCGARRRDARS